MTSGENPAFNFSAIVDAEERQAVEAATARLTSGAARLFPRDGIEFRNREGQLPAEAAGFYREYTVPTLGVPGRGARRIVAGHSGALYYSPDHYGTFIKLR